MPIRCHHSKRLLPNGTPGKDEGSRGPRLRSTYSVGDIIRKEEEEEEEEEEGFRV